MPWHLRQSTSFLRCFENKYSAMLSVSSNVALVCNRLQASGADPSWLLSKHNINNYYLRFKRYLHLNLLVLTVRGNALFSGEMLSKPEKMLSKPEKMLSKPEKMLSKPEKCSPNRRKCSPNRRNALQTGEMLSKPEKMLSFLEEGTLGQRNSVHVLASICFSCKPFWISSASDNHSVFLRICYPVWNVLSFLMGSNIYNPEWHILNFSRNE